MLAVTRLNPNIWWYFARAGGLVAWGLLAATVFWGLIYAGRLTRKVPPPAWNLDLHRFLGGLSLVFVAIHVAALTADKYVDFGLPQVLLPFASHWRPGAVAWGIVAMYLVVAVEVTSLAMRWLPRRLWRQIHLLSFVLFVFSTVHAIESGTDMANPVVRALGIGLLVTATVVAVLRILRAQGRAAARGSREPQRGAPKPLRDGPARPATVPAPQAAPPEPPMPVPAAPIVPAPRTPTPPPVPARRPVPISAVGSTPDPWARSRSQPSSPHPSGNGRSVTRPSGTGDVRPARPPWPPRPAPGVISVASTAPRSGQPVGDVTNLVTTTAPERRPKVPRFAEPPPVERRKSAVR